MIELVRTNTENEDLLALVAMLDAELKERDGEDHYFFAQFNKLAGILGVVIAYEGETAVGCGGFKEVSANEAEIKSEVLAEKVVYGETDGYVKEWNINKEHVTLGVTKL